MSTRPESFVAKIIFAIALAAIAFHVTGIAARGRPLAVVKKIHPLPPAASKVAPPAMLSPPPVDEHFVVRRILDVPMPFRHGEYVWDDAGVPPGPIVITVDLTAQMLSVFRGGYEIGAAVILYGADEKPTPLGIFPITQKDAHHISTIYEVPMPYMLRLTGDGVSIHGSQVEWNKGTSGCIGVPMPFAKLLFGQAKLGDPVIITNGKMLRMGERITAS